ncbi:SDR family oxidoreductase [Phyllobacterium lublinensis]|uniref:SDR family oxidoreductase n=1 Tax=Phyllobacterium lublinensis TaxID=2875708 RepID=UPI001CCAF126|nr:SDR family oxidoreductase [Phyllobacterium sp. 2063]MBZ9653132.1 SDR family oxidoreductase [Phyllobacterium sp. 2063]
MKVLVLGGTGFIGQQVCQRLLSDGHVVTAVGRDIAEVCRRIKQVTWRSIDIGKLTSVDDWVPLLAGVDAVVNCVGALQDGARDNVTAVQLDAMLKLYEAAAQSSVRLVVQISTAIEGRGASLPFIATKRAADEALVQSTVPHIILRPALVIGRNAHGGTALIRSLASFPLIVPLIHSDRPVEIVALSDLTEAVSASLDGRISTASDIALASRQHHTLADVVLAHRSWLGLGKATVVRLPHRLATITAWLADCAGFLGWRSPLRSTAMKIMADGVFSSNAVDTSPSVLQLRSLEETLSASLSGVQDLWFARLYLLKPLIILVLALFWTVSGIIALLAFSASTTHLADSFGETSSVVLTVCTSLVDIVLGCLVLFRRFATIAMTGMLLISIVYLIGGSLFTPTLWLDPLGPYVKVIPSLFLTLVGMAVINER